MVRAAHERTRRFYFGLLAWLLGVIWLVSVDLGVVAFTASVLFGIWVFGLRERFESEDTASAYSVFNHGGAAIVGGFTGKQFDRQMRGGIVPEDNENVKDTEEAPLWTIRKASMEKLSDQDKLKRRRAAAAAAERRLKEKQQGSAS